MIVEKVIVVFSFRLRLQYKCEHMFLWGGEKKPLPIRKQMNNKCLLKKGNKMKNMNFSEAVERSVQLRKVYHRLERQYHETEWTVEEDALAFLTDAGLVGRLTMSQQGRWPTNGETESELEHKIGECIWWLINLAERTNIDSGEALEKFLTKTEKKLGD